MHIAGQPMFDESDDVEDEHEWGFSGSQSYQGMLREYINFGNENSQIQHFQHSGNQKQFDNE